MQQVALAAIDAYLEEPPAPQGPRVDVPAEEFVAAFADLPPMDLERFRADQDRTIDKAAYFDAFERASGQDSQE